LSWLRLSCPVTRPGQNIAFRRNFNRMPPSQWHFLRSAHGAGASDHLPGQAAAARLIRPNPGEIAIAISGSRPWHRVAVWHCSQPMRPKSKASSNDRHEEKSVGTERCPAPHPGQNTAASIAGWHCPPTKSVAGNSADQAAPPSENFIQHPPAKILQGRRPAPWLYSVRRMSWTHALLPAVTKARI